SSNACAILVTSSMKSAKVTEVSSLASDACLIDPTIPPRLEAMSNSGEGGQLPGHKVNKEI
ncbi:MAG: hypothetical protein U9N32_03625, partial [Spirochaetota bacterium]|nr:hypothetical protein [Spirochaetota bacterium]